MSLDSGPVQAKVTAKDFDDLHPRQNYYGPKPMVLLILDGWGIGPNNAGNAIMRAQTPNIDNYQLSFPHTQLGASGEYVGLPEGEDGNTETGHLNIGAGTIVYQNLPKIDTAIENGSFFNTHALVDACTHAKTNNSALHIMGLVSSGTVHSSIDHLYALIELAKQQAVTNVFIHAFTDGRDSPPTSGIEQIQELIKKCQEIGVGRLASLMGRYYAMDRDQRWPRIEQAYNTLTVGSPTCVTDPIAAIKEQYDRGVTDEFIEPVSVCDPDGQRFLIRDNDAVIFFNFRIDRPRELTKAFVLENFEQGLSQPNPNTVSQPTETKTTPTFKRSVILKNLFFATMTEYEKGLPVNVAFSPQLIENPICKVFASYGLKQLRMSETEKEKFVTYHMNGQKDEQYYGEDRVIVPSKGVKSYDEKPEMSAQEIAQEMLLRISSDDYDVIIANIANPDMVAHTGNLEATIKACELTDQVVGQIVRAVYSKGGVVVITGDHGNAEELINNKKGGIDTEHSIYPVPLIIIGQQFENNPTVLPQGILADVAPTMLSIMGIPKPDSMTGRALI